MNSLPNITSAFLTLTHRCPLACVYCFLQQENKDMTLKVAKDSVDFLYENSKGTGRNPSINLFGGEPMLLWDEIIEPLIKYIRQDLNIPFDISMTTNGILLDEARLEFLSANEVGLLLSIDGGKETQNHNRPFHSGNGSFEILSEIIPNIIQKYPNIIFRSTLIPETCDNMFEDILYAKSCGFKNYFAMPNQFEEWSDSDIALLESNISRFARYYVEQCRIGARPIKFSTFENCFSDIYKINRWESEGIHRSTAPRYNTCGLGSNYYAAIDPNGFIYTCQELTSNEGKDSQFCIGDIYSGVDEQKRKSASFVFRSDSFTGDGCESCILNPICNGGCVANNYLISGDVNKVSKMHCVWNRILFKYAVNVFQVLGDEENDIFKNIVMGVI